MADHEVVGRDEWATREAAGLPAPEGRREPGPHARLPIATTCASADSHARRGDGHVVLGPGVREGSVVADREGDDAVGAGGEDVEVAAVVAEREVEGGHAVDGGGAQERQLAGR